MSYILSLLHMLPQCTQNKSTIRLTPSHSKTQVQHTLMKNKLRLYLIVESIGWIILSIVLLTLSITELLKGF